jgi:hypothetical protein
LLENQGDFENNYIEAGFEDNSVGVFGLHKAFKDKSWKIFKVQKGSPYFY